MALVEVLPSRVCLLLLLASHEGTAIGCLLQASALVCFRTQSLIHPQCMFFPNSEDCRVDFVHMCRSRHEDATMIIVDDRHAFDS
jgi:hypothetical protein